MSSRGEEEKEGRKEGKGNLGNRVQSTTMCITGERDAGCSSLSLSAGAAAAAAHTDSPAALQQCTTGESLEMRDGEGRGE